MISSWLLFVALYVTGFETVDWPRIPLLSLFVTSLSTFGKPTSIYRSVSHAVTLSQSLLFVYAVCLLLEL